MLPSEYIQWMNNPANGMVQDSTVGNYTFSLIYRPTEMLLLKELKKQDKLTKKTYKQLKKEYTGVQYFNFRIKPLDVLVIAGVSTALNEKSVVEQNILYFSFDMQHDLKLVEGGDTLRCKSFTYERTFDYAPYYSFLAVFEDKQLKKPTAKTIVYQDKILGTGTVALTIPEAKLREKPRLKINIK